MIPPWLADPEGFFALAEKWTAEDDYPSPRFRRILALIRSRKIHP